MDIQLKRDGAWKRIKPEQARRSLVAAGSRKSTGPDRMLDEEIADLLGEGSDAE